MHSRIQIPPTINVTTGEGLYLTCLGCDVEIATRPKEAPIGFRITEIQGEIVHYLLCDKCLDNLHAGGKKRGRIEKRARKIVFATLRTVNEALAEMYGIGCYWTLGTLWYPYEKSVFDLPHVYVDQVASGTVN